MGFLVNNACSSISPGALMILFLSDEMDMDLRLPEILGLLGEKMMMKFLEIFGGRTIEVPSVRKVRKAYKIVSAHIRFYELVKVNSEKDAVDQTGAELDMTPKEVRAAWVQVRAMLARLEESVKHVTDKDKG